jgi:hypothetical protein
LACRAERSIRGISVKTSKCRSFAEFTLSEANGLRMTRRGSSLVGDEEGTDTVEKQITVLHYVLLVLSLGIVAGSVVANRELSRIVAESATVYAQSGPAGTDDREIGRSGEQLKFEKREAKAETRRDFRISNFQFRDSVTPRVPNLVHLLARHADGTIFYDQTVHNLRTSAGANWQFNQMAGTTAGVCTYLALSNDSGAPSAADTALAAEITANGLARASATPAHSSNTSSYTLTYTFTATGTQAAQKAGLLNASSGGTLCFENTFAQVNMNSGDSLQVVWNLNF